jgi:hypothetical protein
VARGNASDMVGKGEEDEISHCAEYCGLGHTVQMSFRRAGLS